MQMVANNLNLGTVLSQVIWPLVQTKQANAV